MTMYFQSIITVIAPITLFFIPGIALVDAKAEKNILSYISRVLIWSMSLTILVTLATAYLSLPLPVAGIVLGTISAAGVYVHRHTFFSLPTGWHAFGSLVLIAVLMAVFSIPFLVQKQGLPSGDAQKAIYWAEQIRQHSALPDYSTAYTQLNRDPVDFYTPGLHTAIAWLQTITPFMLQAVGFLAIITPLAVAIIAAAIAKNLFDTPGKIFPATFVLLLSLSNIRFLRYLKEPGYHLQNSIGELLLFGLLMLVLALIHRWRTKDAVLACACILALLVSHQFSAFIGAWMLLPVFVVFAVSRWQMVKNSAEQHPTFGLLGIATCLALVAGGFALNLQSKIPFLFTSTPHLIHELPLAQDYPRLLGDWWLMLGAAGLGLLAIHTYRKHLHWRETAAFCAATAMLIFLSQAPRFFVDIPPVRALFYLVIPLSISGAYMVAMVFAYINTVKGTSVRLLTKAVMLFLLLAGSATTVVRAYQEATLSSRTNSTLTPALEYIIHAISQYVPEGAIISDDYGKRSGSWLLLTGRPTFARLVSDTKRPMLESRQSSQRMNIYLNQLDFEKIYSLGNWPGIQPLMEKHAIAAVVGTNDSSASVFSHNPILTTAAFANSMQLFAFQAPAATHDPVSKDTAAWLLKASTLANDIGDDEDIFLKLPASLPTTRLSAPQFDGSHTYRTSTAPVIVLNFNMADYTHTLWDKDNDGKPDTAMELFIRQAFPSTGLLIKTPLRNIPVKTQAATARLTPEEIPLNDSGHIVITILNPGENPVAIDMIALGLSHVP